MVRLLEGVSTYTNVRIDTLDGIGLLAIDLQALLQGEVHML